MKRLAWVLVLLLVLGLGVVARADEVTVLEYPASNYAPGPGWPEGWKPPAVPKEVPAETLAWVEQIMQQVPQFTRWEVRVLEPLPAWTQEYPYWWELDEVGCGDTIYLYWYPYPDTNLTSEKFGKRYAVSGGVGSNCEFAPIQQIDPIIERTEEEKAADLRKDQFIDDMDASHRGLDRDFGDGWNGTPESIHVFFNMGHASPTFDVPAYLDTTVSRVRVPVRFISEMMGAQVNWDSATGQVEIYFPPMSKQVRKVVPAPGYTYEGVFREYDYYPWQEFFLLEEQTVSTPAKRIVLTIGKQEAVVNGQTVPLDAPPVEKQGRTMVPIRFVAEQLGAKVYWVGDQEIPFERDGSVTGSYQVHIFTPFYPLYEYPSWYLERFASGV